MNSRSLFLFGLFALGSQRVPAPSQTGEVTILLLQGRTGKPIAHHRLLIFHGDTPDDLRYHRYGSFDLNTDESGVAVIPSGMNHLGYMTAFADSLHPCQSAPNLHPFSLGDARSAGLIAENTCGAVLIQPRPGRLVLFAREPTWRERMKW